MIHRYNRLHVLDSDWKQHRCNFDHELLTLPDHYIVSDRIHCPWSPAMFSCSLELSDSKLLPTHWKIDRMQLTILTITCRNPKINRLSSYWATHRAKRNGFMRESAESCVNQIDPCETSTPSLDPLYNHGTRNRPMTQLIHPWLSWFTHDSADSPMTKVDPILSQDHCAAQWKITKSSLHRELYRSKVAVSIVPKF